MSATATKAEGIARVIENNPVPYAEMKAYALKWIAKQPAERKFTWEEIRKDFESEHTLGHYNLCGGLMSNLSKAKVVTFVDTRKAERQPAHSRRLTLWEKAA